MTRKVRQLGTGVLLASAAACASAPGTPEPNTSPRESRTPTVRSDTAPALVPAGFGTLRQDDIALKLQVEQVQVRAIPLDEAVIRVLAPDS